MIWSLFDRARNIPIWVVFVAVLGTVTALSVLDALQEDPLIGYGLFLIAGLADAAVAVGYVVARGLRGGRRPISLKDARTAAGLLIWTFGVGFYLQYWLRGLLNPDTAGQMHVVLFPILYLLSALVVACGVGVLMAVDKLRKSP
jgi:hypothetical protein